MIVVWADELHAECTGWTWRLSNISWTRTACLLSYPQFKIIKGATSLCTDNVNCWQSVRDKGVH